MRISDWSSDVCSSDLTYRALGWQEALGSSGTNKAIGEICAKMGLTKGAVTAQALPPVRDQLLRAGRIEAIDLPDLSDERRPNLRSEERRVGKNGVGTGRYRGRAYIYKKNKIN